MLNVTANGKHLFVLCSALLIVVLEFFFTHISLKPQGIAMAYRPLCSLFQAQESYSFWLEMDSEAWKTVWYLQSNCFMLLQLLFLRGNYNVTYIYLCQPDIHY